MTQGKQNQLADIDGGFLPNPHQSIFAHIELGLLKSPHKPAVICMHQDENHLAEFVGIDKDRLLNETESDAPPGCLTLTYSQLHRGALRLAAGVLASGLDPGSTVMCMIPNGAEYTLLLWTCALLRLTIAAIDPAVGKDKVELRTYLQIVRPSCVIVANLDEAKSVDAAVGGSAPGPSQLRLRILLNSPSTGEWTSFRSVLETGIAASQNGQSATELLLAEARRPDPDRIHSILFTSGTTSAVVGGNTKPKACPLRVSSMTHILESQSWLITSTANNNCARRVLQQAHNARAIAPYHTLQTWRVGGAIVMPGGASFDVQHTLEAILHYGATFIVLSPAMVHALAGMMPRTPGGGVSDRVPVNSVRTIQVGGDAVTREVLTKCAGLFPDAKVCINHGMSEGGGLFVWPFFETPVAHIPYLGEMICPVGKVAPGARVKIWDAERGVVVKREQPGEMHVKCESLITGYLSGVEREAFYDDGEGERWMNTGDIAMVSASEEDGDDLVYILGRSKDAIKCGGIAIMPAVLESCIEKYTGAQVSFALTS